MLNHLRIVASVCGEIHITIGMIITLSAHQLNLKMFNHSSSMSGIMSYGLKIYGTKKMITRRLGICN